MASYCHFYCFVIEFYIRSFQKSIYQIKKIIMEKILFWKGAFFLGMLVAILISFIFSYSVGGPFAVMFGGVYFLGAFVSDFSLSKRWQRRRNFAGAIVSIFVVGIYFPSVVEIFLGKLYLLEIVITAIIATITLMTVISLPFAEKWALKVGKKIRDKDEIQKRKKDIPLRKV